MARFEIHCAADPKDTLTAWPDVTKERMCIEIALDLDSEDGVSAPVALDRAQVADLIAYLGAWLVGAEP